MKRPAPSESISLDTLLGPGAEGLPIQDKLACLQLLRAQSPENAQLADRTLLERLGLMGRSLRAAEHNLAKMQTLVDKLTCTPWFPGVFVHPIATSAGTRAVVQTGSTRRIVALGEDVNVDTLRTGDEVFLSNELNVVMAASPDGVPPCGETALFDRRLDNGRMVLKWRDDEIVVEPAAALRAAAIKTGDVVRFDRNSWVAYEILAAAPGREFLMEEVPPMSRDQIGGQEANYETLISTLTSTLAAPQKARQYHLNGRNSILMVGPPGCGKTLMARVAASEASRLTGRTCRFSVVKPAAWESPWVGMTQKAIRDTFAALKELSEDTVGCVFLDEIESIGRTRGGLANVHSDKFLAAFLAELNGFEDRTNIAIIAATNRKDLVDPALLERLSDVEIQVHRPGLRAARAILRIHLPATLPFSPNGTLASDTREELIETALSRFYAPNADNRVCTLRFRDGNERPVFARELVSGRFFEQVCRSARRRAFDRDVRGGEPGIQTADMEEAIAEAMNRLRTLLTRHNAHAYLADLPQDTDVVAVQPERRRVPNPRRFLNLETV
ncbi:MAG: AAA family ATPase [Verrucomicrobia bacterium]|nr:AAA family ATPase [Verrucomicrobiota bacterium]